MAVAKIITTILNAIAATAKRKIALEKDFLVAVPTRLAIKNSRFKMSINLVFDTNSVLYSFNNSQSTDYYFKIS